MRVRRTCVALCFASIASSAGAQSVRLTEAEFLSRVASDSPQVRAIRASVDVARADVLAAGRWPNPRVSWNRESAAGVSEHIFSVSQPLPITGRRGLDVQAASAIVEATSQRAADDVRRWRADARSAFASLVAAQAREAALSAAATRLRDLGAVLARREAAGESAGFDRLRVEREAIEVETQRSLAAAERARARATLSRFLAVPLGGDVEIEPPGSAALPLPSVEDLLKLAERTRGEFAALAEDARAASLAADAANRRRIPEPEIVAGTKSSSAGGGDVGGVIAVHVGVPLFDRAQPERAAAQARASLATARTDAFRASLRADVTAWHDSVRERRAVAEQYRQSAPGTIDQIERIAQVSYEAGERGLLDLLDVYRTTVTSRLQQLALDETVRQAEIELEFVSGWEAR